ncbi:MAG: response regulator transcription factor [Planctomycetota bacterium]|jgi:DNA-binding response OmpR family regulator
MSEGAGANRPRILVVEDEEAIAMALEDGLALEGYAVTTATDGDAGLAAALKEPAADVILLDLRLPGRSGLDVLRGLRGSGVTSPVIVLTARGSEADRVAGLECGADDYVVKPFSMAEVIARVRAHLRRAREYAPEPARSEPASQAAPGLVPESVARFGDVEVDFDGHRATKAGLEITLSALELKILFVLWRERGKTVTRSDFLTEVWGYQKLPVTRTVDFHVGRLRGKVEDDPKNPVHIVTHHGVGYRLQG